MVKLLAVIFAFYILLLPCAPCTDADECNDRPAAAMSSVSTGHDDHENEACNPFCSCACCGQIVYTNFQPGKEALPKSFRNLKRQFFYTSISLSSDFFGNIWQPPKFS
jgi:hypothetical protein